MTYPLPGRRAVAAYGAKGLLLALGVAAGVRIAFVGSQSFSMDELTELRIAGGSVGQIAATADGFPPLYHVLLHGWLAAFGSDGAARWLSVVLGIAAVYCVWKLARLLVGERGAGFAALLFAVMPFHIWYSQEARAYSLVILLAALTLWLFYRARERGRWRDWAWFIGAGAAGMYAHYFFAALLATAVLCLLLDGRGPPSRRRAWASLAMIGVLCVPDLLFLRDDLAFQTARVYGKPSLGPAAVGYTYFSFVSGYTIGPSMRELHTMNAGQALRSLLWWLPLVVAAIGYAAWSFVRSADMKHAVPPLVILTVVPVLLVGLLAEATGLGYNVRYVSWVVVPVAVGLGAGLAASIGGWPGKAALALLVLIFALARWNRVAVDRYREEDSRALATFLERDGDTSRRVLVTPHYMAGPIDYDLDDAWTIISVPDVGPDGAGLARAIDVARGTDRSKADAWLVYTRPFHGDPGGRLAARLVSASSPVASFAGIELYLVDAGRLRGRENE